MDTWHHKMQSESWPPPIPQLRSVEQSRISINFVQHYVLITQIKQARFVFVFNDKLKNNSNEA